MRSGQVVAEDSGSHIQAIFIGVPNTAGGRDVVRERNFVRSRVRWIFQRTSTHEPEPDVVRLKSEHTLRGSL